MNFNNEIADPTQEVVAVDLSTEHNPRDHGEIDTSIGSNLAVISAKHIVVIINSTLSLNGVTIPAQGDGYLTVWANLYSENGGYKRKVEINALDLTPAGPNGEYKVKKALEDIPPGKYNVYFDFMSYWKYDGRFTYSTYAAIEGDGGEKWGYQLVATQGQDNPKYESAKVTIEVVD